MSIWKSLNQNIYVLTHHLLTREKRPLLASYKLTYGCNLRCSQCSFYDLPASHPGFLLVQETLDLLYRRGNRIVIFEGGEPMSWKDGSYTIHDVARLAKGRFFCTGITTNGCYPLDVETDILWVSIDGFRETHNQLRGAPIFDLVMKNIKRSHHPRLLAHITANSMNVGEIPALVKFLAPKVKGITIQFYYPYHGIDNLFLPFDRREKLIEQLILLKRDGYPILNSVTALENLKYNHWKCEEWLIDCANPDGSTQQGCYLKGRAKIDCALCGFSPYTEMSMAYHGHIQSILAGNQIFFG